MDLDGLRGLVDRLIVYLFSIGGIHLLLIRFFHVHTLHITLPLGFSSILSLYFTETFRVLPYHLSFFPAVFLKSLTLSIVFYIYVPAIKGIHQPEPIKLSSRTREIAVQHDPGGIN